jgi:hypothetical protein
MRVRRCFAVVLVLRVIYLVRLMLTVVLVTGGAGGATRSHWTRSSCCACCTLVADLYYMTQ